MNKKIAIPAILGLMLSVLVSSAYVVHETKRAITVRLGSMVKENGLPKVQGPGLHFKIPFLDKIKYMDARINTLDIQSDEVPTKQKKNVIINLYVKWRVQDFSKFYVRASAGLGWSTASNSVHKLLRQKTVDSLRTEVGKRSIKEVVSEERKLLMQQILTNVKKTAEQDLGIEIVDIRVKRIDLPDKISDAIYNLMRTERQRIAEEHRARGREEFDKIVAEAEARGTVILAEASKEAKRLEGEANAEAAKIFTKAHMKNYEFYNFYRSLDAYSNAINSGDILVLKPEGEFFANFKKITAK